MCRSLKKSLRVRDSENSYFGKKTQKTGKKITESEKNTHIFNTHIFENMSLQNHSSGPLRKSFVWICCLCYAVQSVTVLSRWDTVETQSVDCVSTFCDRGPRLLPQIFWICFAWEHFPPMNACTIGNVLPSLNLTAIRCFENLQYFKLFSVGILNKGNLWQGSSFEICLYS